VAGLLGSAPLADPRSPSGVRVERFVEGPGGLVAGFAWGFAEAVSWPVIAEVSIGLLAVTAPRRMVRFGFAVAAGSVAGALTTAALARRGILAPAPLTTPRMRDEARRHLSTEGVVGVRHQAFNGIPIKVYAREAGLLGLPAPSFGAAVAVERTARIVGTAVVGSATARLVRAPVRRRYGTYAVGVAAVWGVGVWATRRRWL
jgi:membrane protein YqaA with SNARE-associated domain